MAATPYTVAEQVLVLSTDHRGGVCIEGVSTQETPPIWTFDLDKVVEVVWVLGIGNGNQS